MPDLFDTPVLFIIFNRPDATDKVFEQIAKIKPRNLYIAADGPRKNNGSDRFLCDETRKVVEKVDWECDIKTRFIEDNLGCALAVSSALSWFFSNVEEGIVLEEDCLPDLTFFYYCRELLEMYRNDAKVFHIGGYSCQDKPDQSQSSYYFTNYPHIWGWASWRRAWMFYDFEMAGLDDSIEKGLLEHVFRSKGERRRNLKLFKKMQNKEQNKEINTWDFQWAFSIWKEGGMAITPRQNMIQNIGMSNNSTHRFLKDKYRDGLTAGVIVFPMVHPVREIDKEADIVTYEKLYSHSLKRALRIFRENNLKDIMWYFLKKIAPFKRL